MKQLLLDMKCHEKSG